MNIVINSSVSKNKANNVKGNPFYLNIILFLNYFELESLLTFKNTNYARIFLDF